MVMEVAEAKLRNQRVGCNVVSLGIDIVLDATV